MVSIHARHCWRANHEQAALMDAVTDVSIHARHCWRANLKACSRAYCGAKFQSTPAIAGGRIENLRQKKEERVVSIHARHCWRANRFSGFALAAEVGVSIHARHCWRANPAMLCRPAGARPFQSTPAIAGGRIDFVVGSCFPHFVSIHARHCWRANQCAYGDGLAVACVSIHARHCWRANRGYLAPLFKRG